MSGALVDLPPAHERRGQLQVQDRRGAQGTKFVRGAAGGEQAVGAGMIEQVDRAELVQGPQPPQRELGCLGGLQRLPEGRAGGIQIMQALGPAEDLQGVAANLGPSRARRQRAVRQADRARVVVGG